MQQLQILPFLPESCVPIVSWDDWIQGFQNFLLATDFAHATSARRCAILIYFLESEGQHIVHELGFDALTFNAVTSADIPCEDARDIEASSASTSAAGLPSQAVGEHVLPLAQDGFQRLVTRLRNHFVQCKNVTLERRRFKNRSQAQGDEISRFVAALRRLAATCEFCAITDSILRDQFIEGIASRRLPTRLYAEPQRLTFRGAVDVAIVFEQTEKYLKELTENSACQAVSSSPVVPRWRPVGTAINKSRSHPPGQFSRPSRGRHQVFHTNRQGEREVRRPVAG